MPAPRCFGRLIASVRDAAEPWPGASLSVPREPPSGARIAAGAIPPRSRRQIALRFPPFTSLEVPVPDRQKYLFPAPTWTEIARAAREAIRAVKADFPNVEDIHLAALIDAESAKTITRLERMETKKVPASLFAAIAHEYGEQYVRAYRNLLSPPESRTAINALPVVCALSAKLAASAQAGGAIDHVALAGMQQELREAESIIAALRARSTELGIVG